MDSKVGLKLEKHQSSRLERFPVTWPPDSQLCCAGPNRVTVRECTAGAATRNCGLSTRVQHAEQRSQSLGVFGQSAAENSNTVQETGCIAVGEPG